MKVEMTQFYLITKNKIILKINISFPFESFQTWTNNVSVE